MTPYSLRKRSHRVFVPTHEEFVTYWKAREIDVYFVGDQTDIMSFNGKRAYNGMCNLYKYLPLVGVSLLVYFTTNFWLLFGIPIYYLGGLVAKKKWLLIYLYSMFCLGIWMREGFSFQQYVTVFYICILSGYTFFKWAEGVYKNDVADFLCDSEAMYDLLTSTHSMVIIKRLSFYSKFG